MVILEVGLGGRLDATNIVDADVAVVTSIALDHTDWLGPDRESIGREKRASFAPVNRRWWGAGYAAHHRGSG
nr:Bifunctional protein folC [Klebsiella pneumoniae]